MKVRKASQSDAREICDLLHKSIKDGCIHDHDNDEKTIAAWLKNKIPENVMHWITDAENYAVIAEQNGKITGMGMITVRGEINLCYVLPGFFHQGIGKELLHAMEDWAKQHGINEILLNSTKTAREFYKRNRYAENGPPDNEFVVTAYPMRKKL